MAWELGSCRVEELPALNELANRVFRGKRPGNMAAEYPLLFAPENVQQLRVARDGERIVAHVGICIRDALILGARIGVASIGAVCTDPDYRGQGIGSALMEDAARHSRSLGASLMLISGTRGLYRRLGYVQVGRFREYSVPSAPACEAGLFRMREDELDEVIQLHQREPVRFHRPRDDWERVLAAGMLMNQPAEIWVSAWNGRVTSYLAAQRPSDAREMAERGPRILEFAGQRLSVMSGAAGLAASWGSAGATIAASADDLELAESAGVFDAGRGDSLKFGGTLGVLDGSAFFAALRPYLEERLGRDYGGIEIEPAGTAVTFALGEERRTLGSMEDVTTFIFGGGQEASTPQPPARLAEILGRAFPMPLPWYGFNYV